jgi:DNA-binding protein HU-beta
MNKSINRCYRCWCRNHKAAAKLTLESFLGNVSGTLNKGGRVSLVGFGSWSVSARAARDGRNPQTGKTIQIAARTFVKIQSGCSKCS